MAVIGIDLGTTNSLAAYWKDGEVKLIPNCMGEFLTPSVVSYIPEEEKLTAGIAAKERLITHAKDTKASFKCFMGTEKQYFLGGQNYWARELSAMVLAQIKQDAERFLGEEIEEAVITVPAYFNDKQRSDTKKAAQLAGLSVKRLINEPSAAALAYRMEKEKEDTTLLIFDFGGGTLDLSLVECFDDVVEIIAVAGDNHLGGDDIDNAIVQWFCTQTGLDYEQMSPPEQKILLKKCEIAKKTVSAEQEAVLSMEQKNAVLTEEILVLLCMPLFSKMKTLFLRILKDSGYAVSEIDDLVMAGGSSKLSIVQNYLTQLLGKRPVVSKKPDYAIAQGAGIYAGIRARKEDIRDMVLTDVCPFTLGIASNHTIHDKEDYFLPMIERNSTLPVKYSKMVYSMYDYQIAMRIEIYQGEEYYAKENLFLGEIEIELPPKPAGEARVEVCFCYDLNGILQVEAVNEKGEKKQILLLNRDLTEQEVQEKMHKMEQIFLTEEAHLQGQKERLLSYYAQAVGAKRLQLAYLIGWYEQELDTKKWHRQKRAAQFAEKQLASLDRQEELEETLFDGELKFADMDDEEELQ